MNRTLFMLLAQYDGKPMIPAETACKDFFAPCTYPTFLRKLEAGDKYEGWKWLDVVAPP